MLTLIAGKVFGTLDAQVFQDIAAFGSICFQIEWLLSTHSRRVQSLGACALTLMYTMLVSSGFCALYQSTERQS